MEPKKKKRNMIVLAAEPISFHVGYNRVATNEDKTSHSFCLKIQWKKEPRTLKWRHLLKDDFVRGCDKQGRFFGETPKRGLKLDEDFRGQDKKSKSPAKGIETSFKSPKSLD